MPGELHAVPIFQSIAAPILKANGSEAVKALVLARSRYLAQIHERQAQPGYVRATNDFSEEMLYRLQHGLACELLQNRKPIALLARCRRGPSDGH
jgi:hypothetical protein